uniref:Uncharacterized protein n=1 Tax=Romanomermis culicivorax TaxID=13658 RepID=A0A915HN61_ROMCU
MQDKRVFPIMGKIYCVECHWGRKIEAEAMQIEKDKQSKNPSKGVQT